MPATLQASNALEVAHVLTSKTPETLSQTAKVLYLALVATAIETGKGRGYSPATTHVTFHLPLEILADTCGVSRISAWRHLPGLRELGVLDYRTHKGSCRGKTRNTGTLWQVRLNPSAGSRARLSYNDLKHRWRDLDADLRRGRTSYAALKHTKHSSMSKLDISRLLVWTLPPNTDLIPDTPVSFRSSKAALEAVLDVQHVERGERNQMVNLAAEAFAQALADAKGIGYYQKLLWQLLRRFDATGEDYSYQVYLMAQRAKTDVLEGFSRRGGAVFVSRLKQADFYEWVMNAPPVRVGMPPKS